MSKTVVVALGGNALLKKGEKGTVYEQFENTRKSCVQLVKIVQAGHKLVLTHGNGPQVGAIMLQNEASAHVSPPMPLGICVTESQGFIGYMVQQCMSNAMEKMNMRVPVVTLITQTLVDDNDPSFANPTKPIGQFYTEEKAKELMKIREDLGVKDFVMKEDSGRGWRRVVASPDPKSIIEHKIIRKLADDGIIPVCVGGGGSAVARTSIEDRKGPLDGREVVIDKDLASSVLAREINADEFVILTDVEKVAINFGKPNQQFLDKMTVAEARKYLAEGQFGKGSMAPKVEAAVRFVESGKPRAIIASLEKAMQALDGKAGTVIVP
ncbi:MAG: carbamate kinase [Candidatus Thermoplasmatota archaeon]|nr:carbamate kinase [Candidatus Thermoplasmatota archaeon]